jgi:hypothetical protein
MEVSLWLTVLKGETGDVGLELGSDRSHDSATKPSARPRNSPKPQARSFYFNYFGRNSVVEYGDKAASLNARAQAQIRNLHAGDEQNHLPNEGIPTRCLILTFALSLNQNEEILTLFH